MSVVSQPYMSQFVEFRILSLSSVPFSCRILEKRLKKLAGYPTAVQKLTLVVLSVPRRSSHGDCLTPEKRSTSTRPSPDARMRLNKGKVSTSERSREVSPFQFSSAVPVYSLHEIVMSLMNILSCVRIAFGAGLSNSTEGLATVPTTEFIACTKQQILQQNRHNSDKSGNRSLRYSNTDLRSSCLLSKTRALTQQ